MNWRETSGDKRSQSPSSLRRRTSEPRVEENRHCHSHWFLGSSREGPVTNGLAGSSVRDHYNESRLYENKDEHFRNLSQFCENLQRESPSKKFRWENLFAKNPANANSKSSLGFKHVNGCDDGDNRGIRVSGSHLGTGSSSKDILDEGNNLRAFHMNSGATKDSKVNNGDTSRSFGIGDCSRHLSSSRKFDGPVYETSDVHVRDRPIFESARNSHRERRNGTSSHGIEASHPHSSACVTESKRISQDDFHGFYEDRLRLAASSDSTWKKEKHREPVETELNMEGLLEYKQARGNHIEHFDDRNLYFKVQPCKRSDIGAALNSPFSQQMVRIPQDDFYQDSTRTSVVMDPVVEGFEDIESYVVGEMEENRPSDPYDFFKEPFIIEGGSYLGNAPFAMEQDGEVLGSGTGSPLKLEREAYLSSEKLLLAEEDGYRTNYGKLSHGDGLNGSLVSKHEQDLSDMEDSRKRRWKAAHSTKPRVEGTRHGGHYPGSDSSRKPNVFSRIQFLSHGDEKSTVKDIDINLNCINKRWNDEGTSISLTSSRRLLPWVINHASKHSKSKCRDLKKRLGISMREPSSNIQERERERKRNKRLRKTNVNNRCLDFQVQAGDCFEEETQNPTTRPLEDPEDLNQLIKSAFLKFVKVLGENPARRKKFTEPGSGIIKCIVCGSNSKQFADALSLSQHAFQSLEASRAEHLGLHKALCWLMGWSSEAAPNGIWVRRILPLVEVIALKEDLIIWPPVLIIHNSSIAIDNTSERVTISCEELEVVIRGMGCGGKMKVARGKPGNQSILVATFDAMFSGLQEAERLHKGFADKNHGRAEFQKINSSHPIDGSHNDLHKAGANRIESVLYGYLGLAEDLDKLDFETKKRTVVKSKKEIQAIVDASLHC